jgi:uncharacterized membrane protein
MKLSTLNWISLAIVGLSFLIGVAVYPQMPESVASHWNLQGQADGYMGRFWGTFLFPILMTALFLGFQIIPKIDPKYKNINTFRNYFEGFILVFNLFLICLYSLVIAWNLGYQLPFNVVLPPLLGGLFFYIGILMEHSEPNWSIGVRTPWTLSSDKVWEKTHRLGAKLFKGAGVVGLLSALVPDISFFLVLGTAIGSALFLVAYSYYSYRYS